MIPPMLGRNNVNAQYRFLTPSQYYTLNVQPFREVNVSLAMPCFPTTLHDVGSLFLPD